ncbi:MAG: ADP-ribosylglycohydrolase family protein [Clostridia bacterium]|nr:ADP-ribosylglycohydrolase family protein [Clostridia bacterium]
MTISDIIYQLRVGADLSQEKFASMLNVSRQAVQKWETGTAKPDLDKLIAISKFFNISLDALVFGDDARVTEEMTYDKTVKPNSARVYSWENYAQQLPNEYRQSWDEGLDVETYKGVFSEVARLSPGAEKDLLADALYQIVACADVRKGYPYHEPSALDGIRFLRADCDFDHALPSREMLADKIRGAWYGRIAGCLLGKPIEGIRTDELVPFLTETGNYPMHRYILHTDITDDIVSRYRFHFKGRAYPDTITEAPVDDDTNYTVLSQLLVRRYGRDFKPYDVSRIWVTQQSIEAYCTSERVVYRNFIDGYAPPSSAVYKNPYREWLGAQIRADYYGYINPGDPRGAAEMAWRDASVSHVKNGIYSAMYIAALIACAAVTADLREAVGTALSQIPTASRLYEALSRLVTRYDEGVTKEACFADIHEHYDEHNPYVWCHSIPNTLIVTAALLYGGGDFGASICMAVETGFDTDCNGATVGSVLGMLCGYDAIDPAWVTPFGGKLATTIFSVGTAEIEMLVQKTLDHLDQTDLP